MAKKGTDYFEMFTQGVAYACEAADLLRSSFEHYEPEQLRTRIDEMHRIEHTADGVKHDMMQQLMKEFLPPIEREDIMELASTIDDVTDSIEDVLLRMYMFNITTLRDDVQEYTDIILKCCDALLTINENFFTNGDRSVFQPDIRVLPNNDVSNWETLIKGIQQVTHFC